MQYQLEQDDGVKVVHLEGPTDVSQALELRELLGQQIDGPAARVLVDLSGVTLVDSSGIGVFVSAHRRAAGAGARFVLAGPAAGVGRVFELTRTNRLLDIFPSVDAGLEALRAA
jgi:anti-anti-sigma factor